MSAKHWTIKSMSAIILFGKKKQIKLKNRDDNKIYPAIDRSILNPNQKAGSASLNETELSSGKLTSKKIARQTKKKIA